MSNETLVEAFGHEDWYPLRKMLQTHELASVDALSEKLDELNRLFPEFDDTPGACPEVADRFEAVIKQIDDIALTVWTREMIVPLGTIVAVDLHGECHAVRLDDVGMLTNPDQTSTWVLYGQRCHEDGSIDPDEESCILLYGGALLSLQSDGTWRDVPGWGASSIRAKCGTQADLAGLDQIR
jgi:hypothetical protein